MASQPNLAFDNHDLLDQQVSEILTGKSAPMVDAKMKHLVYQLNKHRGAAQAVKIDQLTKSLGVSDRAIKQMVKDLVEVFGLPVGASRKAPYGYFLAVTSDELKATCDNYFREAVSLFYRIARIRGSEIALEYEGQLRLELAKPAPPKEAA